MEKKGSKIIQLMKVSTKMTAIYGSKRPESNEWDFNGDVIQCLALCEDGDVVPVAVRSTGCVVVENEPDFIGILPYDLSHCPYPTMTKKEIIRYFKLEEKEHDGQS